jgi:hypothetical protein
MNGPTSGPMTEPKTEEKTMKATAYCCSLGSYRSATIPRVTLPPAEDRPPRPRATITVAKLGARAAKICHTKVVSRSNEWCLV